MHTTIIRFLFPVGTQVCHFVHGRDTEENVSIVGISTGCITMGKTLVLQVAIKSMLGLRKSWLLIHANGKMPLIETTNRTKS